MATTRFVEGCLTIVPLLSLIFASCVSCVSHTGISVQFTQPKLHNSVALVESISIPGPVRMGIQGTAWAIDKDHLMTAGHVCAGHQSLSEAGLVEKPMMLTASDKKGGRWDVGRAEIIASVDNRFEDMCLMKLENHGMLPIPIASSIDHVETEDRVYFVGAPVGMYPVKREGFIISTDSYYFPGTITFALNVQSGASGSPLMHNGQAIGLIIATTSVVHNNQGLHNGGIAVPAPQLLKFIEQHLY